MNINIGKIICTAGATCRFFPVEILTCIFFFISQELHIGGAGAEPLMFLPYAFAIVFSINQIAAVSRFRAAYYASFLAIIPLAVTDLMRFLSPTGYLACLLLAIFVVILSGRRRGNREIARYFSSMVINIAFSLLLTFVVCVAAAIIFSTISFIFNIWADWARHIPEFIFSIIWPVTFCMFHFRTESDDDRMWSMSRIAEIAVKFIICPAIIIYTAILYIYLLEITFTAELPKGGVAALIIAFYAITLAAKLLYSSTSSHNFNWFFNRFHYISVPLIVLFAVGISYRIGQYGFTEERVYLVVAGVAMILFSAMMMWRRTASYRTMMVVASAFIVVSTLIPGVNAKQIGIKCQTQRMLGLAKQIGILQDNSNVFVANAIMVNSTDKDYEQICDCYSYLCKALGDEETKSRFGDLPNTSAKKATDYKFRLSEDVDCSAYPYLLSNAVVDVYDNGLLKVTIGGETIYEYMLDKEYFINHASDDCQFDQNRLIVGDEHIMVVIQSLSINNSFFDIDAVAFSAKKLAE